MATKILPSADGADQLGQSTANGDDSNLRWDVIAKDVRVEGNLTVTGTTTSVQTTNTAISDALIELNNGESANTGDVGIIMERGSTGDNAAIIWDESADKFVVGTTTATGSSTGNLTVATGTLVANLDSDSTLTSVKVATAVVDSNSNELIAFPSAVSNAVNQIKVSNAATGNNPILEAEGGDVNVGLDVQLKGTGSLDVKGTADKAAQIKLYEDTLAGTEYVGLLAADMSASYTLKLPTGASGADAGKSLVVSSFASGVATLGWNTVSAGGISDGSVTLAKHADLADLKVLGNTSGSTGSVTAVSILDEDDLSSDSATSLATQQSVKAYVDDHTTDLTSKVSGALGLANGGTGATSASDARTALGLAIGSDVQAFDAQLSDVAGLTPTDSHFIVGDGSNFTTETGATARTSLGLGSIATQAADSVAITGGTVQGITDLAVADGGTGASDASGARTNLGLAIGSNVQAYHANLADVSGLSNTDGNFIVGDGSNFVAESGATARASLGLGSIATQAANSVAITGGTVQGITDLAVADGGTGASNAAAARTNLGLAIGSDVQAYDAQLADVAGLTPDDGKFIVGDGSNFVAESGATARASLGLGSISTQAADSVAISGGTVQGITDLAVADGGTGASSAADARTNLGLVIGTNVQAYDAQLSDVAALTPTDSHFIVGDGSNFTTETGATARTSLGLGSLATASSVSNDNWSGTDLSLSNGGTGASNAAAARTNLGLAIGSDVQAYDAQLADIAGLTPSEGKFIVGDGSNFITESGSDARTTLGLGSMATQAASSVSITGGTVQGITDLALADGGTGASTASGARTNLGLAIGTNVQAYHANLADLSGLANTNGNFIVGDGSNFVAESGATARASLGLGNLATQSANSVAITGGDIAGITDLAIADGGTGASTASAARTNLGLAIGSDVQAYDAQLADIASNLTATAAELNYNDITTLGTTQASKVVTTDANGDISALTGSITITGSGHGLTINNGDLNVTGDAQVTGALQVNDKLNLSGSVATIGATTLKMDDSLIELNYLGADTSSTRDIGIIGRSEASSTTYEGLVYEGNDGWWKFVKTTSYPGADNYVTATTSGTSVQAARFVQGVADEITSSASTSSTDLSTVIPVDSTSGAVTVTLSSELNVEGTVVTLKDVGGQAGSNNISIDASVNTQVGTAVPSGSATVCINSNYGKAQFVYVGSPDNCWFEI